MLAYDMFAASFESGGGQNSALLAVVARQWLEYAAQPLAELRRAAGEQGDAGGDPLILFILRHRDHLHTGFVIIVAALHVAPANIAAGTDDMRTVTHAEFDGRLHAHRIDHGSNQQDEQQDNRAGEKRALHFHDVQT